MALFNKKTPAGSGDPKTGDVQQQTVAREPGDDTADIAQEGSALAVQQQQGGSVVTYDFGDDSGAGMENVKSDEYRIPFLRVLDAKSPQCKPVERGGTPGAKAGDILNVSTGEVYDGKKGFVFLPVSREHSFIEWIPKNEDGSGGGFVGVHSPDEAIVGQLRSMHGRFGKLPMDNGNQLAETFTLTGLACIDGVDPFPAVIAFASTNIPTYQSFIGRAMNIKYPGPGGAKINPPLWAHRWRMGSAFKEKGQQNWYIWNMKLDARNDDGTEAPTHMSLVPRTDELYIAAKSLHEMVASGKAKVDMAQAGGAVEQGGDGQSKGSDGIPM